FYLLAGRALMGIVGGYPCSPCDHGAMEDTPWLRSWVVDDDDDDEKIFLFSKFNCFFLPTSFI
ncbi:hypothetical protein A2U01_0096498, partial [Trifolium medium]|nr:hypothetical protein [Trifolium medium]